MKKNRKEISIEILQSSQSSPEDVAYVFSHLYINARDREHAAEIVRIFYENHPETAKRVHPNALSFSVPRAGLEPARPYGHDILSVARLTNFATRAFSSISSSMRRL